LLIAAAALGLAAIARADMILNNGGFESGVLDPWSAEGSFDPTGAEIVTPGRSDQYCLHLDAAEFEDQYIITQSVAPTPVSEIVSASLWSMCPTPRWGTAPFMIFQYQDGTTSEQAFSLVNEWTFTDATAALTPGEVLTGVVIRWYGLGDEGPGSELFLDDISVETVPTPGAVGGLALGLAGVASRRPRRRA
jgi:hypothetical protein